MSMVMKNRLQILIDDERHDRIKAAADARGVSVATIVREAIDRGLGSTNTRRQSAGERVLAAPGMPVPAVEELKKELEDVRSRRRKGPEQSRNIMSGVFRGTLRNFMSRFRGTA